MLRLMLQKLLHKKWLVVSLLIGNILLIAITASYPMYKDASLQKMLTTEFNNYMEKNSVYPSSIVMRHQMDAKDQVNDFWKMEERSNTICDELGLSFESQVVEYSSENIRIKPQMIRDGSNLEKSVTLYSMSDFKEHSSLLSGSEFSDTIGKDGFIDVVVSQGTFNEMELLVGDEFISSKLTDASGNPLKFRITGIFTIADEKDTYWDVAPSSVKHGFYISQDIYKSLFLNDKKFHNAVIGKWKVTFDFTKVTTDQVNSLRKQTNAMVTPSNQRYKCIEKPVYLEVLSSYKTKIPKVESTLFILIIPVFVLLCAFIFMISSQMLSLEDNEISLFKSRGSSKSQIFSLYLLQSTVLALVSMVFAIPLAALLCRVLGSANAFLEFIQRTSLKVEYSATVFLYSFGAVAVSILITILPVIRSSTFSIVKLKQKKARNRKKLWQKYYLDVVILAASLYGFYSFSRQKEDLLYRVMTGQSIDPMLFFSSSLFILGAGLFALRLQPLLVKLIYRIGKKKWKPSNYASFLQIIRSGSKQYFIMVFMILTIALGIFNATIARTIILNAEKNAEYSTGADIVFQQKWGNNLVDVLRQQADKFVWKEPGYNQYAQLKEVEKSAKVYRSSKVKVKTTLNLNTELLGINTKDFGETAYLPDGLNNHLFNEYLNVLSTNSEAVLLSSNYMTKKGYKVGDIIELENEDNTISYNIEGDEPLKATIYGFFDYWPGYNSTKVEVYDDGTCDTVDNYMAVANLSYVQRQWDVEPYQVWLKIKGNDSDFFYDYLYDNNIKIASLVERKESILDISREPLFQGTNGILTMSFIVILILCGIGYLIYWILSIRNRELLFGVFRAMGMSKGEIIHMLINEQLFTGGLAIVLGAVIGVIASKMYIPIIQIAYSGENQALPLEMLTEGYDMIRLFVIIALVFIACIFVLVRLVNRLKIAQALKLGED